MGELSYSWNENTITWFLRASAYTCFHRILAKAILPHLEANDSVCDIGCGLGRLDLELAPHVAEMTALDINPDVVRILDGDATAQNHQHLSAICMDAAMLSSVYDVVIMSFYGKIDSELENFERCCKKKIIRIVNEQNHSRLYPGAHRRTKKDTVSIVRQALLREKRSFHLDLVSAEFGQPLRTWQEATEFVRHHAPEACEQEISAFLDEQIIQTAHEEFPLYLPNQKSVGIFVIERKESDEVVQ